MGGSDRAGNGGHGPAGRVGRRVLRIASEWERPMTQRFPVVLLMAVLLLGTGPASVRARQGPPGAEGSGSSGAAEPRATPAWPIGVPVPVAVTAGQSHVTVPLGSRTAKVLLVVSALGRAAEPRYPVTVRARAAARAGPIARADDGPGRPRSRVAGRPTPPSPAAPQPPVERQFSLFGGSGDPRAASSYEPVAAQLRAAGRSIQVYVDRADTDRVREATVLELIAAFEDWIEPALVPLLGRPTDVDGDGRLTILLSSRLARGGPERATDGFVRGADFDPAFAPPFGNRADLICLNAAIEPGPYLWSVLAHEYTHALLFSRKVADPLAARLPGHDEEAWIDEGLAHLTELTLGFSRQNLDYRLSAFLAAPERYSLVVPDYFAAELFRSHGHRGATTHFFDWCRRTLGSDLLPSLVLSSRQGLANIEAVAGLSLPALYRRWSTAVYLDALVGGPADAPLVGPDWSLVGPRAGAVEVDGPAVSWLAAGTASRYLIVSGGSGPAAEVDIEGPTEAELQVTAIRLPDDLPRLDWSVQVERNRQGQAIARATITERDGQTVTLESLDWERLEPPADARLARRDHGRIGRESLGQALGTSVIPAGGRVLARPFVLSRLGSDSGPLLLRLAGRDRLGRRVVAWAEVDPDAPGSAPPEPADSVTRAPAAASPLPMPEPGSTTGASGTR